jgi:hypothetical protein
MKELEFTLLTDEALVPILTWLLHQHLPDIPIQSRWADLRRLPRPPRELADKILKSTELYPCDLLFIHRDAEKASLDTRLNEIKKALNKASTNSTNIQIPPAVGVVPVRMTETWLLFDVDAIRQAAGNPNGTVYLDMPALRDLEKQKEPKKDLHALLQTATELGSHRKKRFDTNSAILRIPEYIDDFSPLRKLSAFTALEKEIKTTLKSQGWNN